MSDITIEFTQPPPLEIEFVTASPITIDFMAFDTNAWVASLPEYANNGDAVAAIGTSRLYVASAASDIAARGTVFRTY